MKCEVLGHYKVMKSRRQGFNANALMLMLYAPNWSKYGVNTEQTREQTHDTATTKTAHTHHFNELTHKNQKENQKKSQKE